MENFPALFQQLLGYFVPVIGSAPTADSFLTMVMGWTLCNGRHTVSAIIRAAGPLAPESHDAYQNFFSKSKWDMDVLWRVLFYLLVGTFSGALGGDEATIWIAGDEFFFSTGLEMSVEEIVLCYTGRWAIEVVF